MRCLTFLVEKSIFFVIRGAKFYTLLPLFQNSLFLKIYVSEGGWLCDMLLELNNRLSDSSYKKFKFFGCKKKKRTVDDVWLYCGVGFLICLFLFIL